jgi:tetratricopeptide (TPR) repeat protein
MSKLSLIKETLNKMLFLEFSPKGIMEIFKIGLDESIYLPLRSSQIIGDIESNRNMDSIDLKYFIEGMVCVLGCDEKFKFHKIYIALIKTDEAKYTNIVKGIIAEYIKKENYLDAYIMLKGLLSIQENADIYEKIIWVADIIRKEDQQFAQEEIVIIEKAKMYNIATPFMYEAFIYFENKNYEKALLSLISYEDNGGKLTEKEKLFKHEVEKMLNYEDGKQKLYEDPLTALKKLLPLVEDFDNNAILLYYIGVGYRLLKNYEKAIYYQNEALYIDNDLVDVVNELGLNYACINHFDVAVKYFSRAFEVTNSIEICTNLIMCYIYLDDKVNAHKYLELAKKIDKNDDIVSQIEERLGGNKAWS